MTKQTRRRFTPEYKEQAVARLSEAQFTIRTSKVRVLRLMRETGSVRSHVRGRHTDQGLMTEPSSRTTLMRCGAPT